MALKGLIDATLEQELKIAALEKKISELSNTANAPASDASGTTRDLGALKEWLKE